MANFSFSQIVGKTLTATNRVGLYRRVTDPRPVQIIEKGQPIGVLYSWVKGPGGLWAMFEGNFYVPVAQLQGKVNVPALQAQGSKTIEQEAKERREKELREGSEIEYYLKKYGVPAFGLILAAMLLKRSV